MRGKKTDSEFLSEFISSCLEEGLETPQEIVARAKNIINEIDEEIKKLEKRKLMRSKLLDVVFTFDKPVKIQKAEEVRALNFFKIQKPIVCKYICDLVKKSPTTIDAFKDHPVEDIMFCLKQLLENKVVCRTKNTILRGDMFEDYLKFVLKEE